MTRVDTSTEGASPPDFQLVSRLARWGSLHELNGHFVAGSALPCEPDGWQTATCGRWRLAAHPGLPVRELRGPDGSQIGWVLGHPLERGRGPAAATMTAPAATADELAAWLYRHDGRFAAVAPGAGVVLPDAAASLPVLFDAERELVASSPFLLDAPDETPPDDELAAVVRTYETGLWFPFATTPHARARRLLANHALDLRAWTQSRRWPTGPFAPTEPEAANAYIAGRVTQVLAAAAVESPLRISLTSGGDTRALLGCARNLLDRAEFFTIGHTDAVGAVDAVVPPKLAARFGFDYRVLPWQPWTTDDVRLFMYRTGGLVGEHRGSRAGPTYAQLGGGRPYVSGVGTGLAPVTHDIGWERRDRKGIVLDPPGLLRRFALPQHPLLLRAAADWLAGLPDLEPIHALALMSMENRAGNWGGALTNAYPEAYSYTLYPFCHRDIVEAVVGLPTGYRFRPDQRADIARVGWPELLDFPINPLPPRERLLRRARAARTTAGALARRAGLRR